MQFDTLAVKLSKIVFVAKFKGSNYAFSVSGSTGKSRLKQTALSTFISQYSQLSSRTIFI